MNEFGNLRGLLQQGQLHPTQYRELWCLIQKAAFEHPQMYQEQWLPYLNGFKHHFSRVSLAKFRALDDFKQACFIAPFACFSLNLFGDALRDEGTVALAQSSYTSLKN